LVAHTIGERPDRQNARSIARSNAHSTLHKGLKQVHKLNHSTEGMRGKHAEQTNEAKGPEGAGHEKISHQVLIQYHGEIEGRGSAERTQRIKTKLPKIVGHAGHFNTERGKRGKGKVPPEEFKKGETTKKQVSWRPVMI